MERVEGHLNDGQEVQERLAIDTAINTLIVVLVYLVIKMSFDGIRQWRAKVSILVVGAGPVGLTAALVAVRSGKVLSLTILDERSRTSLLCRPQQIALDPRSVKFLLALGVDFDNIEGCWHNDHFFTKIGVFQEHVLSILEQRKQTLDIRILLGTKFTEEYIRKMSQGEWPKIIIVADGSCGESSSLLGVNSEFIVESCNAYGANAALERPDQRQVMRNIFHQSFNAYKTDIEPRMSDLTLPHLQCSRRLFEIVLSHRRVTSAFIEGDNIVVTLEGEAVRVLNFDTGCGVNLGLRGLESSEQFIYKIATAVDQSDVFEALAAKIKHSKQVVEEFKLHGLLTSVFE
ncbi:hypothetical protein GDO81_015940 [Engystomops pustulosus]|uniref:FAD-binding domain-containing protein n=1 Tax=Engystomops pustulosus TaxID=76066 RepID=A0AAV7AWD5_ENGPU|nr:hypothetical protein GDO81_015940 [Engystomops pustulosus]KAG8563108.1 hypothetical protein GDO81_015940 [Engystomops pustulosus]KAG8563109.1 hypothetical protein GDO81_015940 [Engystomops pustulosus]KAG8563110.1 hypothetical protein GDO81_015940 [Engystomops pustulosus]KAG8563111.1 hypothetical protein GDO81_015940 [Engystomops pustulosus]